MPQLLSLCSRAQKPQRLNPRATAAEAPEPTACAAQQEKPLQGEAEALQLESSLNLLQLQKSLSSNEAKTKELHGVKNSKELKNKR